MSVPRQRKQMMMFIGGVGYAADTESVTLPKLERKLEKWRGGALNRPAPIDLGGGDDLTVEHSYGGPIREIIRQYGLPSMSGVQIRFAGSHQDDSTGESRSFKVISDCGYYKEEWDGVTDVEIDILGMVEIVGGVDLMAGHRDALGLS